MAQLLSIAVSVWTSKLTALPNVYRRQSHCVKRQDLKTFKKKKSAIITGNISPKKKKIWDTNRHCKKATLALATQQQQTPAPAPADQLASVTSPDLCYRSAWFKFRLITNTDSFFSVKRVSLNPSESTQLACASEQGPLTAVGIYRQRQQARLPRHKETPSLANYPSYPPSLHSAAGQNIKIKKKNKALIYFFLKLSPL